jgi:isopenicillin N synthase-like dioxygenase
MRDELPVIDIGPLLNDERPEQVAHEIGAACRRHGFFYIHGHEVAAELQERLEQLSREFFALETARKQEIAMNTGGRAWRGYFAVGDELTSGQPDQKEGIYFGEELPSDDPRVQAGLPLHGPNLFPDIPRFRDTILDYLKAMTKVGHAVMRGIALSLDMEPETIRNRWTYKPTILFRVFHYPPLAAQLQNQTWSVGEHTDYGLLTLLRQDQTGGLQVKTDGGWIDAPPIPGTFVCNLGDMLDRVTGGHYRSTPHRVFNSGTSGRLSFPFFFDPAWDASIGSLFPPESKHGNEPQARWDGVDLQDVTGTYGEYLLGKVSRVFPELASDVGTITRPKR